MGTERNGSFAAENDDDAVAKLLPSEQGQTGVGVSQLVGNKNSELRSDLPLLKGRVPIKGFPLRTAP